MAFEHLLEEALSANYSPDTRSRHHPATSTTIIISPIVEHGTDMGEEEEEVEVGPVGLYKELVPVIGYVSPSLGSMVSPYSVTSRLEVFATGRATRYSSSEPRRSLEVPRKRKAGGGGYSPPPSHRQHRYQPRSAPRLKIDEKMELLRSQIHQDVLSDDQFEKRLEAALRQ